MLDDEATVSTLHEAINLIKQSNGSRFAKTEYDISERGNRTADRNLLQTTEKTLGLRKKYNLVIDYSELLTEYDPISLNQAYTSKEGLLGFGNEEELATALSDFKEEFTTAFDAIGFSESYKPSVNVESLNRSVQNYLKEKTLFNLLVLDMSITEMESKIVGDFADKMGHTDLLCFMGEAFVYPQTDTARTNEAFQAIITLGDLAIGESVTVGEPKIWINDQALEVYEMSSYGKSSWLFSYIPRIKGEFRLQFAVELTSSLYEDKLPYPYGGEERIIVQ